FPYRFSRTGFERFTFRNGSRSEHRSLTSAWDQQVRPDRRRPDSRTGVGPEGSAVSRIHGPGYSQTMQGGNEVESAVPSQPAGFSAELVPLDEGAAVVTVRGELDRVT